MDMTVALLAVTASAITDEPCWETAVERGILPLSRSLNHLAAGLEATDTMATIPDGGCGCCVQTGLCFCS